MAVYTHLSPTQLQSLAETYGLGTLKDAQPIAEGVENSNYLLTGETRRAILTIYEKRVRPQDVPFFLDLMHHLADKGLAVPLPLRGKDGAFITTLPDGKLAAAVSFLEGRSVTSPTMGQCEALGAMAARLHLAVWDFEPSRPNDLSLEGWKRLRTSIGPDAEHIQPGLSQLLDEELARLEEQWPEGLQSGVVHADLFPDNVFFEDERLSGVIDFYFAATDSYLYDLAVTMNAWCFDAAHRFDAGRASALLRGYQTVRPLPPEELAHMPLLARGAALRFLLTRAYDWLNQEPGALVRVKDPLEYLAKLMFHRTVQSPKEYGL